MKALVYHGPNKKSWDEVPDPTLIDPTDAIVAVDATTICGSDLHILKGDLPEVTPGRILGHEAVGTVEAVGTAVRNFKAGDRVLVSCISACGKMPLLPREPLRAVSRRRWMDTRPQHRRDPGRKGPGAFCRYLGLSGAGRHQRRGIPRCSPTSSDGL